MSFTPVESQMILGVRYNDKTRELDVVFRTGEKYRYKSVPRIEYEELMRAKSLGQYMHKRILNRYEFDRLD